MLVEALQCCCCGRYDVRDDAVIDDNGVVVEGTSLLLSDVVASVGIPRILVVNQCKCVT